MPREQRLCVRCRKTAAVPCTDQCGQCAQLTKAELENGMTKLEQYLRHDPHVRFAQYLRETGRS